MQDSPALQSLTAYAGVDVRHVLISLCLSLNTVPSAQITRTGACSCSPSSQSEGSLQLLQVIVGLCDHHPDSILQEGVVTPMNSETMFITVTTSKTAWLFFL